MGKVTKWISTIQKKPGQHPQIFSPEKPQDKSVPMVETVIRMFRFHRAVVMDFKHLPLLGPIASWQRISWPWWCRLGNYLNGIHSLIHFINIS